MSLRTAVTQARVFLARLKKSRLTLDCRRGQPGAMEVSPLPIKKRKHDLLNEIINEPVVRWDRERAKLD